jgi:hypothetical protein
VIQATIEGWTLREAVNGKAVLEGPNGIWRAGARRHRARSRKSRLYFPLGQPFDGCDEQGSNCDAVDTGQKNSITYFVLIVR